MKASRSSGPVHRSHIKTIGMYLAMSWLAVTLSHAASTPGVSWPARDGLGRTLPMPGEVGAPKEDRFVGIFYFLWLDLRGNSSPHHEGPYDVSKILARDPDALSKPASPLWGTVGTYHYWAEPLYGYYLSTDPWVLRRHAQLLADAGVDVLIFDTDGFTLDFKWADNLQVPGDVMDFYLSGDVAPDSRFRFRYTSTRSSKPGGS